MTDKKITTKDDVFNKADKNHIWLNAFDCVNPTPEFCQSVGKQILYMLNERERLIPSYYETAKKNASMNELSHLTPMLYLSINKS